jgi:hypothetical protein
MGARGVVPGLDRLSPPVFVLTRLAESLPGKEANLCSEDWISGKVEFLKNYSMPSLLAQSDPDFRWLVSVSEKVPKPLQTLIETVVEPFGQLVFQRGVEHSTDVFGRELKKQAGHYVTVRFDSDDVLHADFVTVLKSNYHPHYPITSFVNGVVYDIDAGIAGHWPHVSNTFLSYVGSEGSNIYGLGEHTRVQAKYLDQLQIIHNPVPMWMKLVHKANGWGDTITNVDRPIFGNWLQSEFPYGEFETRFFIARDARRILSFFAVTVARRARAFIRARRLMKKLN